MKSEHLTNGIFLVLIGGLLLFRNMGVIPAIPWGNLLQFWPMLIVIAGLQLLFPKGFFSILAPLVLVVTVAVALLGYTPFDFSREWHGEYTNQTIAAEDSFELGQLRVIDVPISNVHIVANPLLAEDEIQVGGYRSLITTPQATTYQTRTQFTVTGTGNRRNRFFSNISVPPLNVRLNTATDWDIALEMGVAVGVLDLTGLNWQRITVDAGITNLTLQLNQGEVGRQIRINSGLSRLVLEVHRNANVRINSSTPGFLTNLENQGFTRQGDIYLAPYFNPNIPITEVFVDSGLSNINVRWQ